MIFALVQAPGEIPTLYRCPRQWAESTRRGEDCPPRGTSDRSPRKWDYLTETGKTWEQLFIA